MCAKVELRRVLARLLRRPSQQGINVGAFFFSLLDASLLVSTFVCAGAPRERRTYRTLDLRRRTYARLDHALLRAGVSVCNEMTIAGTPGFFPSVDCVKESRPARRASRWQLSP